MLPMSPEWTEEGWRRERDSNPRYPLRYSGFQDHRHRPLGHLSARRNSNRFEFSAKVYSSYDLPASEFQIVFAPLTVYDSPAHSRAHLGRFTMNLRTWCRCFFGWVCLSFLCVASAARADEIWVAPTYQTDLGGVGIGSNGLWPVSVVGASRLAWAIPNDLLTFSSARVALIPHAPGGAATLNIFICSAESADLVTASCAGPFAHAFHGVPNQLLEIDISAAVGSRIGVAGQTYLSVLAYSTPTTATDHIVGLRFVYDAVIPNGVATLDANTFTGAQTAPAFVGNGSGLTNVSATLLDGLDSTAFAAAVHGHNVSQVSNAARLAGGNSFIGTQRIDAGNLDMAASTSGAGSITKDGVSFLHDFGALNTFVGRNAGNFSLSGTSNTAIGASTLQFNSDGSNNTAIGLSALQANTTGDHNTAIGVVALASNTDGQENTAVGAAALATNTSGIRNIALGVGAGNLLITGSNNIYIGAASGGANESNTTYLGRAGTQTKTFIAGIRGITTLNANAIPVMIDPPDNWARSAPRDASKKTSMTCRHLSPTGFCSYGQSHSDTLSRLPMDRSLLSTAWSRKRCGSICRARCARRQRRRGNRSLRDLERAPVEAGSRAAGGTRPATEGPRAAAARD